MNTERALQLGRLVLESELAAVHPGHPERCLCHGTGEIIFFDGQGKRVAKYCAVAVQAFQHEYRDRVDFFAGSDEPWRWKLGMSPEEWGLAQIFHAEAREQAWQRSFSARARDLVQPRAL